MATYLFAVQDETGREVCSWQGDVERVTDVSWALPGKNTVTILRGEDVVARGHFEPGAQLTVHRVPVTEDPGWKIASPVSHSVK